MGPLPLKEEWRSASTTVMAVSAMISGMNLMPESSADSLDITIPVGSVCMCVCVCVCVRERERVCVCVCVSE